jgi:HD-like signal output (HDOD) protein
MPSLPTTVTKVLEICNDPKVNPSDLNRIISMDPVLMAKVLKLINSAYYGTGQQVTSLARAIIMLGINTVKNLALSTAALGNFSRYTSKSGLDMDGFWRHSLCVGVAAKLLAKKRGVDRRLWEEYFCAGLLHDIGKIPVNAALGEDYMLAVSGADKEKTPLFYVEDRLLNMNHCIAGQLISEAWKIQGALRDVISYHHNYSAYNGAYKDVLFSVVAVNRYANISKIGFAGDPYPEQLDSMVMDTLHIQKDTFVDMEDEIMDEIEKAKLFLNV